MKLNKLLTIITASFLIFTNHSNAHVNIDFIEADKYRVECDGQSKVFNDITKLLNEINNFIGHHFTINSITLDREHINTIVLRNINVINNQCILVLRGNNNFKPNILFDNGGNILAFHDIRHRNIGRLTFTNVIFPNFIIVHMGIIIAQDL